MSYSSSGKGIICAPNFNILIYGYRSSTTSLASSVRQYRQENGRTYHSFREGGEKASKMITKLATDLSFLQSLCYSK